jgi:hypothetical protein
MGLSERFATDWAIIGGENCYMDLVMVYGKGFWFNKLQFACGAAY